MRSRMILLTTDKLIRRLRLSAGFTHKASCVPDFVVRVTTQGKTRDGVSARCHCEVRGGEVVESGEHIPATVAPSESTSVCLADRRFGHIGL